MLPVHPSPLAHPAADVWTLLADIAELTPDAPAFLHGERALSFAGLLDGAERAAQGLADLGVGPGDRVALWLPNIPAYPILYFACAPTHGYAHRAAATAGGRTARAGDARWPAALCRASRRP